MKDTVFGLNNTLQSMVFPFNHPKYPNQPKGIKQILIERELWHNGLRLECELCKGKNKQIDPTRIDCYARKIVFTTRFSCTKIRIGNSNWRSWT